MLAVSDLVVGALTGPVFIAFHVREAMRYPVMENIWIIHLTFFVSYTASLLSLAALTLDRYLTVIILLQEGLIYQHNRPDIGTDMGDICVTAMLLLHRWILLVCVPIHERRLYHNNQYINVFVHPHPSKTEGSNLSLALVPTDSDQT
ncbi:hypothetical protein OS493_017292 [Desmophyllum pertusum]|uniref:G-protein coupled receptors family 1 profile domain-containing protein n=1 Tax=Desmophyllum pertusum TaxID=174260 RepID=A0A9X0A1Y2_9CNID|nr:hypothetical protein OS493_017292 [Desmophyllum pertusum]